MKYNLLYKNNFIFIVVDNIVLGYNDMVVFEFVVFNFMDNEKDFKIVWIMYIFSNCNNIVIIIEYLLFLIIYILIFSYLIIFL